MTPLVLASSSPWRRELLERLGLPFSWASPDIDETRRAGETPTSLVQRLSLTEAEALADAYSRHLIIGSDQVALFDDQILGKPHTQERACAQLRAFSGQRVRFVTGLALLDTAEHRHWVGYQHYDVIFRRLTDTEISTYVEREQPLQCAGSFRMEGLGITLFFFFFLFLFSLFERLEGEDPNSLIGLPLILLCRWLREAGADPLGVV